MTSDIADLVRRRGADPTFWFVPSRREELRRRVNAGVWWGGSRLVCIFCGQHQLWLPKLAAHFEARHGRVCVS